MGKIVATLCGLAALVTVAHARDPEGRFANSPFKQWFKSQYNSAGAWCCDESDGHRFDDAYTVNADGSVTLNIEGQRLTIPASKVLADSGNPTGSAVVWYRSYEGSEPIVYCFAPGTLG